MNYNRLLFRNETVYGKWQTYDRAMYDEVNTDVNFTMVTENILFLDKEYPIFFLQYPVNDAESAEMRKCVFDELYGDPELRAMLTEFVLTLNRLNKLRGLMFDAENKIQKQYYHLQTVNQYIACVERLCVILDGRKSKLLADLFDFLGAIKSGETYTVMKAETETLMLNFDEIQRINIAFDYSKGLLRYEKNPGKPFALAQYVKESLDIDIKPNFSVSNSNPITALEESLINYYSLEYPDVIAALDKFFGKYENIDVYELINLKPQIKFYTSYVEFMNRLEADGCKFSSPTYSDSFHAHDAYDLSLALTIDDKSKVVSNDIDLSNGDIFVLSGPNQGGKTTFVRTVAIIVILALNGCHVPCKSCRIPYYDRLITHFNKNEVLGKGGRLQEELSRIKDIMKITTAESLLLFNECFASTRRIDGAALSLKLLDKLFTIGCNAGFVTHYYEIADKDKRLISLTSGVESDGEKDDIRTYKITKSPPEGNAYARTIAQRYGITFEQMEVLIDEHKKH